MGSVVRTTVLSAPRLVRAQPGWLRFAVNGAALVAAVVLIFTVHAGAPALRANEVASETVIAQEQVSYVDKAATAAQRRRAAGAVLPEYTFNPAAAIAHSRLATAFLSRVGRILAANTPVLGKQAAISRLVPVGISATALQQFPMLSAQDFRTVQEDALSLLEQAQAWRFSDADERTTELGLLSTVSPRLTQAQRVAATAILDSFMTPTLSVNQAKTRLLRQQAAARVRPVHVTVYPGDIVVRRGDIITPSILGKLVALGARGGVTSWTDVAAALLFVGIVIAMLFWYLHTFHAAMLTHPRLVLLIDACILVTVLMARVLTSGHVLLPYFLPVAAASTFAAVLIAPEACIALTLAMALLAGWVVASSFELSVYYFLTGAAGVLAIRHVKQVKQFMFAGGYIMAFGLGTVLAFGLVDRRYDFAAFQEHLFATAFNGFVSSALALGGFAVLSSFFGVTTALQLLELGQPSQPLLRRLMVKAPGTYNHSLTVASMVEHAAEEIGADSLAAKVGALYHDVGKTANPHGFVENQLGMGNIHDELRSEESARIIRGHVSQGLRLAKQHRLPRLVMDAIAEHHGTMMLAYFLHKAQEEAEGMPINRSLYIYPGPKPQSKETALLMLADGCESAVRASSDHSNDGIRTTVEHIFAERIEQEQLNECPLTLRDVDMAKDAFCSILVSLYHPRIEYPDLAEISAEVRQITPRERGA